MRRMLILALLGGFLGGCATPRDRARPPAGNYPHAPRIWSTEDYEDLPTVARATPRETDKANFGPPPPGYIRITGEPVPKWQPADMLRAAPPARDAWTLLGPKPIREEFWSGRDDASGRVVSVAPHPTDPNVVYIASASGGVWKTIDAGVTWTPLTDELSTLNHGAVAVDPHNPNVIYAGTGEWTVQSRGDGIFRSVDAGQTWERLGTAADVGTTCSGLYVDIADPQRIHVTGSRGYCRSTDGGATWNVTLSGTASDLLLHPTDPQIVYVARYGDGIYRSLDGGDTFARLSHGLPNSGFRRIIMAISPSDPDVLYAAMITQQGSLYDLYRTADGGDTWDDRPNTPDFPSPQGWYDCFLVVHPDDPNTVYGGGVFPSYAVGGVVKTTNGGGSWQDITVSPISGQLHPDQHDAAFGVDGTMWVANDGGVWKSTDDGASWINCNNTLALTQNYNIALHPTDPNQILGGTQDNGTVGREVDSFDWPQVTSGDGGFSAYAHDTPNIKYTTYVYLTVYRVVDGVATNITGPWAEDERNFIAPIAMDPNDQKVLYAGSQILWRTTDAEADNVQWSIAGGHYVGGGAPLNAIAVAPSDSDVIYTGGSNGLVWVTLFGGWGWYNRTDGLPFGEVSDICIDPADPGRVFVSFFNTFGPRILYSEDYGENWTDVTGTLALGISARALAVDWRFQTPGMWVGAGSGVYHSYDFGQTWIKDGTDLPNVNIGDLLIDANRNDITAGTYGRGAWRRVLPQQTIVGDLNCDGHISAADIDPFVTALEGQAAFEVAFPQCTWFNGDCNDDGVVDVADITPFVQILVGQR
jgi:photosystem II stability/assembly factor-like uncharacterized protein